MTGLEELAVFGTGIAAGTINTIVGSGTLITFPTLLAFHFPPVVANVSNTIGLVPGSVSGAVGYRTELVGQGRRARRLGIAAGLGGLTGGLLLLVLPAAAFKDIVPALIALACVLVIAQPAIARRMARRPARRAPHPDGSLALIAGVYATGVYGGYFGAAQGVMLIGIMGLSLPDSLQRINGLKNILAAIINGVAAILFLFAAHIAWRPALLLAVGSTIGGQIGAKAGRRLPALALRILVVAVGIIAVVRLV
ncbi:MAG TPA: sulfite exporter TauE/SafE family protein [Actinomycetota bacterium]|nr:sulfite exporter TauE/SafE family protein [Actinomycetota bacterium]